MSFVPRAPSVGWEPLPLPTVPPSGVWGWFHPPSAPESVAILCPPELWHSPAIVQQLSLRLFMRAIGIDGLVGASVFGQPLPLAEIERWLDAPLPLPNRADLQLVLWPQLAAAGSPAVAAASTPPPLSAAPVGTQYAWETSGDLDPGEDPEPYFAQIETYWNQFLNVESQVQRARQQLDRGLTKLNSLNRELTFDEFEAADSHDRKLWMEARRFLRDAAGAIQRSIKEVDTGRLSAAGQRNRFQEVYLQFVQPRLPFPGIKRAVIDFEMLQKTAKNVLQSAQTAIQKGTADGERRAQSVLARIARKIQEKKASNRKKFS